VFADSAKDQLSNSVSEHSVAKSKKRKKQSVDVKPSTDEVIKKRKKKKVICSICPFSSFDVFSSFMASLCPTSSTVTYCWLGHQCWPAIVRVC